MKKRVTGGGIYTRVETTYRIGEPGSREAMQDALSTYDFDVVLDRIAARAHAVLLSHDVSWVDIPAERQDAKAVRVVSSEAGDAWNLLELIEQLRDAAASVPPMALLFAYRLGRMHERLDVRPHEPAVVRAKKSAAGGAKGRESRGREAADKAKKCRDALKTLLAQKPHIGLTKARKKVAESECEPLSNVVRYTRTFLK